MVGVHQAVKEGDIKQRTTAESNPESLGKFS
jgi:hypothetical protein